MSKRKTVQQSKGVVPFHAIKTCRSKKSYATSGIHQADSAILAPKEEEIKV
jgi:hypothetical protein